jgi:uncharacterized coiled-coil protein SlyX
VTNSGTTNAATLDFTIPRGDTGATIFTEDGDDIYRQTGNVGIGTNSPDNQLHIFKASTDQTTGLFIEKQNGGSGTAQITFGVNASTENPGVAKAGLFFERTHANGRGDFHICVDGVDDANSVGVGDAVMTLNKDGNVGVGTNSPDSRLEVSVSSSGNNIGANHSIMSVLQSSEPTYGKYGLFHGVQQTSGTSWLQTGRTGNMTASGISNNDTFNLLLNPNGGNVGIGTANPYAKLHVNGIGGYSIGNVSGYQRRWWIYSHGILNSSNDGWANDVSIYANRDIMSGDHFVSHNGSFTSSDQRIKKDIVDVDDAFALESLKLLKPKKYKYKDTISRGEDPVWGFIAQEVRETLPHATRLRQDFIPNIYELSNVSDSNVITFSSFNTSNLETTTSKLRLKCIDGNDKEVSIVEVIDETKIRVNEDLTEWMGAVDEDGNVVSGNQIFVYGEEVDDFVFLKKEVFIPICVSSIQELDRRLEADKARIVELETQQQADKARIVELETQLQSEKSKIATMELLVASLVTRVGDLERSLI